jgi:cytoskeletal protein CcmA (bactofilin family)
MFKSKGPTSSSEPTVIGKGTVVEGTIRVSGRVQIDGQIDGTVIAEGHVSVGPDGSILGEVSAEELAVGGRVEGKITVRGHLHIAPAGIARGDMRYGSLQVDRGGVIDGSTVREGADAGDAEHGGPSAAPPSLTSGRPVTAVS